MSEIKYERNTKLVLNMAMLTSIATLCASPSPIRVHVCTRKCSNGKSKRFQPNLMINVNAQFKVLNFSTYALADIVAGFISIYHMTSLLFSG